MTNREKYIEKASDKELAEIIGKSASVHKNKLILFGNELEVDEIEHWLSQEAKKSADEMFEELGYKKASRWCCDNVFDRKNGNGLDRIVIDKTKYGYYYIKHRILYDKYFYEQYARSNTISEDEDKAIHKKLEELKNAR